MAKLIFVDAGVLIAAARGDNEVSERAMEVLDDPTSEFASSVLVKLEVLPKAIFHRKADEVSFYQTFFDEVSVWVDLQPQLAQDADEEAARKGLDAVDALHVAAAAAADADELITTEKQTKPTHSSRLVSVRTILPERS